MGYVGQRLAESIQDWSTNQGGALLDLIAKRRQQENAERQMSLQEELGRANVGLGRDTLAANIRGRDLDRDQEFILNGFVQNGPLRFGDLPEADQGPGVANAGGALQGLLSGPAPDPETGGVGIRNAAPANAGAALEGLLSGGRGGGGGGWRYDKGADPRAILQEDEQEFRGAEGAADRNSREGMHRSGLANAYGIAEMGERGATERNNANIGVQRELYGYKQDESRAQAAATNLVQQSGGDIQKALQAAAARPDSPAKQAVMRALQQLMYEQGRRNLLGIGGDNELDELIARSLQSGNGQ